MKDFEIRQILQRTELSKYCADGDSKIAHEMTLPVTKSRIDIAVINGHFHGYEIKGASDTLTRLPNQLIGYTQVFDYLTVVTEYAHHEKILKLVPEWVGVAICTNEKGKEFELIKDKELNPNRNAFYIAKLLWRDEILEILRTYAVPHKKKHRNWLLCELLAEFFDIEVLSDIVRNKLKHRVDWKI